jgi:hypothetical protein
MLSISIPSIPSRYALEIVPLIVTQQSVYKVTMKETVLNLHLGCE